MVPNWDWICDCVVITLFQVSPLVGIRAYNWFKSAIDLKWSRLLLFGCILTKNKRLHFNIQDTLYNLTYIVCCKQTSLLIIKLTIISGFFSIKILMKTNSLIMVLMLHLYLNKSSTNIGILIKSRYCSLINQHKNTAYVFSLPSIIIIRVRRGTVLYFRQYRLNKAFRFNKKTKHKKPTTHLIFNLLH